jgi:hypothetical protein
VHRVLAGAQVDIGGGLGEPLAVGVNEAGEQLDRGDVVGGQHGDLSFRLSRRECTWQSATSPDTAGGAGLHRIAASPGNAAARCRAACHAHGAQLC